MKWRSEAKVEAAGQKLKLRQTELSSMMRWRQAESSVLRTVGLNIVMVLKLAGLSLVVRPVRLNLVAREVAGLDPAAWETGELDLVVR